MGDQLQQASRASQPEGFHLYEGGEVAEELRRSLTHVRIAPHVENFPIAAFRGCDKLIELQLNEGLQIIENVAFMSCTALRSVIIPSTVTDVGKYAFAECSSLIELQLNEGLRFIWGSSFNGCTTLQSVTLPSSVTMLGEMAFCGCFNLVDIQLNEGLKLLGQEAFLICKSLRSVTVPSTVTVLGNSAFCGCSSLVEVQLNEGLQNIGAGTFYNCTALRSVTIPSTVTELGGIAFTGCRNLTEVIFLGGEWLFNQEFFDCGFRRDEQGLLDREALDEMLFDENRNFAFHGCQMTTVKISISWAVTERMARLPCECMLAVEEKIHTFCRLELLQDGDVLACFPVVRMAPGDEAGDDSDDDEDDDTFEVRDTNHETARSLHQVLQLISFHELKESSILLELAIWKSKIDEPASVAREDCRVAIPDPAKSLIMEYCGFVGFLEPTIEGA
ncbi:hypothetical protein THAOC_36638 [Thalassiosira oceanica]|uniref:Uncharacterized protein n=1 Tax=Thalassiosira oceanica TaxID=159749 RepID=K0R1K3_THAOC|nr:hypothetical protein THAOC_36638 [Thalassiosira oceanica]|eukprot:EJK44794.1 hypothetical protein THAOC_36638 [Thalassiosira oceanica]